jgi:uncharacterized protein YdeI (YjbR/CyaY-like superfamily)
MKPETREDQPIIPFADDAAWERWLKDNHTSSSGVWIRMTKKGSAVPSVRYPEVLHIALCYGWIDGRREAEGETTFLQRFCPRAKRSIWSQINRQKAIDLIAAGRMAPAGLAEVERAKADGRWDAAYEAQSTAVLPPDLEAAFEKNPRAKAFYATLRSQNRFAVLFRLATAKKPETRAKRLADFVAMLNRGETIYPEPAKASKTAKKAGARRTPAKTKASAKTKTPAKAKAPGKTKAAKRPKR